MKNPEVTNNSRRSCVSCGSDITRENRAKEHVIPQWLLDHLRIRKEVIFQAVASSDDGLTRETRELVADQLLEGRVCESCNSGWMSKLENQAKPVLCPLIDGTRTVHALAEEECEILSKWAAKTAFILSNATPLKEPVPQHHLRGLGRTLSMPRAMAVFTNQHVETRDFSYYQRNRWPHFSSESTGVDPEGRYKIGLQIKRLLILVAHWPPPFHGFILAAGVHIPVWPNQQIYCCYYPRLEVPTPYD
jgi:hypothetical protein